LSKRNVNSIVCLTEESVETLFLLKKENLIKGVSIYAMRPVEAQSLPKVSTFLKSNIEKIKEIAPDLVIGFSDIQQEIAKNLVAEGLNVLVTNQRSIEEILEWIYRLSLLVDAKEEGLLLIKNLESIIKKVKKRAKFLSWKPKVYFEEWNEPQMSAIKWVSELIEICGGENIFAEKANQAMAKGRIVESKDIIEKNPDIIFACWCGKKVNIESIKEREGWGSVSAVTNNRIFELAPEIFLQPGPAPILEGLDQILTIFEQLQP